MNYPTRNDLYIPHFLTSILQMLSSKDVNFVGYTYKNFEIVNDYQVPGMGNSLTFSTALQHLVMVLIWVSTESCA
jgi:hypothetical protein